MALFQITVFYSLFTQVLYVSVVRSFSGQFKNAQE